MSKATETLLALANFNSWRRGDETLEMPPPAEIGATIDDAVNLLRKHDETERELVRLREAVKDLAYWSRSTTETRITLRDRIAAVLANDEAEPHGPNT
jgi:hypothetical protein